MIRIFVAGFASLAMLGIHVPISSAATYSPRVPAGYVPKVVLHVGYGNSKDKIPMVRDGSCAECWDDLSVERLCVRGDRFYFINDVGDTIKQFRSPGKFVWETKRLLNLTHMDVAPDGSVYAIWGSAVDILSRIGPTGRILWTKTTRDILSGSYDNLKATLGVRLQGSSLGRLTCTGRGLEFTMVGEDDAGAQVDVVLRLDAQGKLVKAARGRCFGSDGASYRYGPPHSDNSPDVTIDRYEGLNARSIGSFSMRKLVDKRRFHSTEQVIRYAYPASSGEFVVEGLGILPSAAHIANGMSSRVEGILVRCALNGHVKEEWRFLSSPFNMRYNEIVSAPDGSMYHLRFGEKGIDVIKYTRARSRTSARW